MNAPKTRPLDTLAHFAARHQKSLLLLIFAVGLLIRLRWISADFDNTADLPILRDWVERLQQNGLLTFYAGADVRAYPPLSTYLFAAAGWLADTLSPTSTPSQSLINALIKLPAILADIATAVLLIWQASKQTAVHHILIASLYLLSPAVWYVSVYWGQTDAIYVFFLVAALMLLLRGAVIPAWISYALSLGVKLQGLPLIFLFLLWTFIQHGRRALLKGILAASTTGLILALPWLLSGRLLELVRAIATSSSLRVVQSAYNGWYFILGERAGVEQTTDKLDGIPLSYQAMSLILFLAVVCLIAFLVLKRKEQLSLPLVAAVLTLAAFLFLTDMRERYLFPVLPLLIWAANQRRSLLWLYLLLTATWFFNLAAITSFAPNLWTNLVAIQQPYPPHIQTLKTIAWIVSAIHLAVCIYLVWLLEKPKQSLQLALSCE